MKALALLILAAGASIASLHAQVPDWGIGPFQRPAGAQPIIRPDAASLFDCPMRGRPVRWQATHTFNPAAVVRDGKVYILPRAEDDSGSRQAARADGHAVFPAGTAVGIHLAICRRHDVHRGSGAVQREVVSLLRLRGFLRRGRGGRIPAVRNAGTRTLPQPRQGRKKRR